VQPERQARDRLARSRERDRSIRDAALSFTPTLTKRRRSRVIYIVQRDSSVEPRRIVEVASDTRDGVERKIRPPLLSAAVAYQPVAARARVLSLPSLPPSLPLPLLRAAAHVRRSVSLRAKSAP